MKKIFVLVTGGLFCFFMAGVVFAGAGGSNLTLIEAGKDYLKVKATASIITTVQYELEFEDETENPQPGEYVITLNAFEGESTFPENTESTAPPATFFLYNPVEGPNTVRIEVNPPGDFSESVFTTSQEFVFGKSPLPDLTITRFIPQFTASGKKYAIVDVTNRGNADVTGSVKAICGFWNSENDKYKEKKSFSISKKFMVSGYTYTKKIPLKKKSPSLPYQCTVDPTNLIEESNEDNNVASISIIESSSTSPTTDKTVNLAKCLTQKGVKFYGASWCSYCKRQKELFGEKAVKELNYIECHPGGNRDNPSKTCVDAKIEAFPTWEFETGKLSPGYLTLEQIAEKTSCSY